MIISQPLLIDATNLDYTNVANDESVWSAGTYTLGTKKIYGESVYEVVADPSTTDQPDVGAALVTPTWTRLGYPNQWRMFRDGTDSYSSALIEIRAIIQINTAVDLVSLLGVYGYSASIEIKNIDGDVVHSETKLLPNIGVDDWWEFFFTPYNRKTIAHFSDLPPHPGGTIEIVIATPSAPEILRCGRVIIGLAENLGVTLQGYRASLDDFSQRTRDGFGNLTVVARRTILLSDYDIFIDSDDMSSVLNRFTELGATPVLFVGDSGMDETINFGVYNRISMLRKGHDSGEYALTVEGF